jgi:hypothetical protein
VRVGKTTIRRERRTLVIAEQLTGRDRRTSERMSDDSTLLVSGYTKEGAAFAVVACINDISVGGISFFLDTPVCKNATLQLALCSRRIEGLIFAVRATALRILEDGSHPARYLIGARFQGQFVQIGSNPQIEDTARELEEAVKHDERRRLAENGTIDRCCETCGKTFVVPLEILQVSSPVYCFACHQSDLELEVTGKEAV